MFTKTILLLSLIYLSFQYGSIDSHLPTKLSISNSGSFSIYTFNLKFQTALSANKYLMINFTNYTTPLVPVSCFYSAYPSFPESQTTCTAPNLDSVLFFLLPFSVVSTKSYTFVIELENPNPISTLGSGLELKTVSSTDMSSYFVYDYNPNFESIAYNTSISNKMSANLVGFDTESYNLPNNIVRIFFRVKINVDLLEKPRIKLVLTSPWYFNRINALTVENDPNYITLLDNDTIKNNYKAPSLLSYKFESPLEAYLVFNENIYQGKSFQINILSFVNPDVLSTIYLKIYSMNYNSNSAIEASENDIQLQTSQIPLDVKMRLLSRIPLVHDTPGSFYKSSIQYIQINITSKQFIPENYYCKIIVGSFNEIVRGSVFLSGLKAYNTSLPLELTYDADTLTISNFKSISANKIFFITMRIRTGVVASHINANVSIDKNLNPVIPLFSGKSPSYNFQSNAYTIIGAFTLSMDPTNLITFSITPSSDDTTLNSYLELYFSRFIKFDEKPICQIIAPSIIAIRDCPVVNSGDYNYLKLLSGYNENFFPSSGVTVSITGFKLIDPSNHQDKIYEFYFGLHRDKTDSSAKLFLMIPVLALPTRDSLSDFYQSISNNLCWTTLDYDYPSVINFVGTSASFSEISLPIGNQIIITVFAYQGFKNLLGTNVVSNSSFPCVSNLAITCLYFEGESQTKITSNYFLDWDRVHIYLPHTISSDFHIILPDIFYCGSYTYEIYIGTVNPSNHFNYLYLENQLTISPTNTLTSDNQNTNLIIQDRGNAAAEIASSELTVYTSLTQIGNDIPYFGSALFIITDWQLWVSGTSSATGDAFGTLQNEPVSFDFIAGDNSHRFVLYLPLVNLNNNLNSGLISYLNRVFNPFSLDLPNYSLYVTKNTGEFDIYNTLLNSGINSFSSTELKSFSFECLDLRDGEKNTFCWVIFQANNRLASDGNLRLSSDVMSFQTNNCSLSYSKALISYELSSFVCSFVDSNSWNLNGALNLNEALSVTKIDYFNMSFYVDIETSGSETAWLDFSIRDYSNNYILESHSKSIIILPKLLKFITISSIILEYYSPHSITQMNLTVIFPRRVYPNEIMMLDIGIDLFEKNFNLEGIQAFFYNFATKFAYSISVRIENNFITFTLNNNSDSIPVGSYIFVLNGIQLPEKNPDTLFAVHFTRNLDKIKTLSSSSDSAASFPLLVGNSKPNIRILESKYMLESHACEFVFEVTILSSSLDSKTKIYINFPPYHSPSLFNDPALLYCGINDLQVNCKTDSSFPYRLILSDFPTFLYEGSTFNITVYGINNPKFSNQVLTKYSNKSIVFGVDQLKNGSFSEIASLVPPIVQSLPDQFNYLILIDVFVNNLVIKDFSNHIFKMILKDLVIPVNSGFLTNFGSEYNSLENLNSILCQVYYYDEFGTNVIVSDLGPCEVRGKRVKGYFRKEIPSNTIFNISLINIPTPESLSTINPNNLLISIFNSTEITILSYTKPQMSSAKPYIFSKKQLDIIMNNGSQIVLTQGTYSPTINIIPSDGLRFINNLLLNASFEGFGFKPSSLQILLGDFISNLKIGTDKDLVNGVYSFNFQKKELGFQNIYKNLGTVYLFLTTKSIAIKVPDQIFVNYYGCNMVYILNLTHAPFSGLIINYMLDYESFGETFFIDDQLNTYTSVFSHNNTIANLAFCTSADFNLKFKSTIIYLSLTGTNSKSYYLTNTEINVVFKNKTRVNPPFIGSSVINLGRTSVTLNITSNCDGLMFWRIVQKNYNYKNKTTTEILQYMQIHNFTRTINESNSYDIGSYEISDYMIIYNNTRNTTVRPNNTLIINGLEPSKQYEFFGYARNEFRDISSNFTYLRFTTQSLQKLTKILAVYNRTIYEDEANNFYCYLVRTFQTKSKLIVSSDGTSCSFYFNPQSYYFQYLGQSFSDSSNRTYLYFIPDTEIELDTALEKISELFNSSTNLVDSSVINGGETYGVNFLSHMVKIQQFNQSLLYNAESPFKIPKILNISFGVFTSLYNSSILIKNLELSGDGAVYFIMEPYEKTLEDSDFPGEYYNETIKNYQKPTAAQIKGCLNYLNQTASVCVRAFYYNDVSYDIEIRLVESYTVYKVYYMVANENPMFPIFDNSQVYEAEVLSYSIFGEKVFGWKIWETAILIGIVVSFIF